MTVIDQVATYLRTHAGSHRARDLFEHVEGKKTAVFNALLTLKQRGLISKELERVRGEGAAYTWQGDKPSKAKAKSAPALLPRPGCCLLSYDVTAINTPLRPGYEMVSPEDLERRLLDLLGDPTISNLTVWRQIPYSVQVKIGE